jgi:chromosome partitioning protein
MHIIAIASHKGGAGKSTFAVNLAGLADAEHAPSLLIDTDAQGSLTVWRRLRQKRTPLIVGCPAGDISEVIETARQHRIVEWVFVDGPPHGDADTAATMRAATLVLIPTRVGLFDLAAVASTVELAREVRRPFFVALNAVPPKRGIAESPAVAQARKAIREMRAPVWRGAVAQRAAYAQALAAGQVVAEFDPAGPAAVEMRRLWSDVSQAAQAIAAHDEAAAAGALREMPSRATAG